MAPEFLICVYVGGSFTVETQVDRECGPAAETLASWCQVLGSISGYGVTLTLKQKKLVMGLLPKEEKRSHDVFSVLSPAGFKLWKRTGSTAMEKYATIQKSQGP